MAICNDRQYSSWVGNWCKTRLIQRLLMVTLSGCFIFDIWRVKCLSFHDDSLSLTNLLPLYGTKTPLTEQPVGNLLRNRLAGISDALARENSMPTNAKYRVYRGLTAINSNTVQHCPSCKSPLTFEHKLLQNCRKVTQPTARITEWTDTMWKPRSCISLPSNFSRHTKKLQ
jgi:hypothetical protein